MLMVHCGSAVNRAPDLAERTLRRAQGGAGTGDGCAARVVQQAHASTAIPAMQALSYHI